MTIISIVGAITQDGVDAFRKEVEKAMSDPDYVVITNYQVEWHDVPAGATPPNSYDAHTKVKCLQNIIAQFSMRSGGFDELMGDNLWTVNELKELDEIKGLIGTEK